MTTYLALLLSNWILASEQRKSSNQEMSSLESLVQSIIDEMDDNLDLMPAIAPLSGICSMMESGCVWTCQYSNLL